MSWSITEIKSKLNMIKKKGFIGIPPDMYRRDEGIVGQLLEREFQIRENNLQIGDLGEFELKGIRSGSQTLTLCHKRPDDGLSPIQIFDRFGYIRPSNRDSSVLKKKLFTTVSGTRTNSLDLILNSDGNARIKMSFRKEFICRWDLKNSLEKINKIVLVQADTKGRTCSRDERFHYVKAFLLNRLKSIDYLIEEGILVIDFCIDQAVGSQRGPHDRGPHIRIPKRKLFDAYYEWTSLLD